jgi:hypothetical protein
MLMINLGKQHCMPCKEIQMYAPAPLPAVKEAPINVNEMLKVSFKEILLLCLINEKQDG